MLAIGAVFSAPPLAVLTAVDAAASGTFIATTRDSVEYQYGSKDTRTEYPGPMFEQGFTPLLGSFPHGNEASIYRANGSLASSLRFELESSVLEG